MAIFGSDIKFDENVYDMLIQRLFDKVVKITGWVKKLLYWMIDSRYNLTKLVTIFLKEQVDAENYQLYTLAQNIIGNETDDDKKVMLILKYVYENVRYQADIGEQWNTALQTLRKRYDDCDGKNAAVYVLCRYAGIPAYHLFCSIVDTDIDTDDDIDHFTLYYYSTNTLKMYNLDATYNVDLTEISYRRTYDQVDCITKIYYVFNEAICYENIGE